MMILAILLGIAVVGLLVLGYLFWDVRTSETTLIKQKSQSAKKLRQAELYVNQQNNLLAEYDRALTESQAEVHQLRLEKQELQVRDEQLVKTLTPYLTIYGESLAQNRRSTAQAMDRLREVFPGLIDVQTIAAIAYMEVACLGESATTDYPALGPIGGTQKKKKSMSKSPKKVSPTSTKKTSKVRKNPKSVDQLDKNKETSKNRAIRVR